MNYPIDSAKQGDRLGLERLTRNNQVICWDTDVTCYAFAAGTTAHEIDEWAQTQFEGKPYEVRVVPLAFSVGYSLE